LDEEEGINILEREFQRKFLDDIQIAIPGCVLLKNDSSYIQGIPDWILLWEDKWAMFEIKARPNANIQPNQEYYIDLFNRMGFARFVYPENAKEVIYEVQSAFGIRGGTRVSISK
jgi:hypothetical protein